MTKKEYIKIAKGFKSSKPAEAHCFSEGVYATKLSQWRLDVDGIANILFNDNSRFDRKRFYEACER